MIKVSKKIEYSLMALKYLANKGIFENPTEDQLTTARELEEQFSVPFDTMAKVLQILNSKKILGSIKGTKGGYFLKKDLSHVSYAELIEFIEGKKSSMVCLTSKGTICELHNQCNIITPLDFLNRRVSELFRSLSISDILFGEKINNQNCPVENI